MRFSRLNLNQRKQVMNGFALLEVLVALAIVALALPALMLRMQSIVQTTVWHENKTYAYWIADNKLQELMAEQKLGQSISRRRKDRDSLEYGDREWWWKYQAEEVELPPPLNTIKLYRVLVEVGIEEDKALANLTGFIGE